MQAPWARCRRWPARCPPGRARPRPASKARLQPGLVPHVGLAGHDAPVQRLDLLDRLGQVVRAWPSGTATAADLAADVHRDDVGAFLGQPDGVTVVHAVRQQQAPAHPLPAPQLTHGGGDLQREGDIGQPLRGEAQQGHRAPCNGLEPAAPRSPSSLAASDQKARHGQVIPAQLARRARRRRRQRSGCVPRAWIRRRRAASTTEASGPHPFADDDVLVLRQRTFRQDLQACGPDRHRPSRLRTERSPGHPAPRRRAAVAARTAQRESGPRSAGLGASYQRVDPPVPAACTRPMRPGSSVNAWRTALLAARRPPVGAIRTRPRAPGPARRYLRAGGGGS